MPAVAITVGSVISNIGRVASELAHIADIEVLYHSHPDHFSRSFEGSMSYAQKVMINDARGRETSVDRGTKVNGVLLCRLRIGEVSKTRLNSCASTGGVWALSNNDARRSGLVGRPSGTPLHRRNLTTNLHRKKGQMLP